jgi:putative hemolysin
VNTVVLELIFIAILVVLHGFFSLAEFAIISIRKSRVAHLLAAGDERAGVVEQLQKDPNRLLATVQIGITIVGSTASAIGGIIAVEHLRPVLAASPYPLLSRSAEPVAVTVMVALVSYLLLILGELVPKTLGLQYHCPLCPVCGNRGLAPDNLQSGGVLTSRGQRRKQDLHHPGRGPAYGGRGA